MSHSLTQFVIYCHELKPFSCNLLHNSWISTLPSNLLGNSFEFPPFSSEAPGASQSWQVCPRAARSLAWSLLRPAGATPKTPGHQLQPHNSNPTAPVQQLLSYKSSTINPHQQLQTNSSNPTTQSNNSKPITPIQQLQHSDSNPTAPIQHFQSKNFTTLTPNPQLPSNISNPTTPVQQLQSNHFNPTSPIQSL